MSEPANQDQSIKRTTVELRVRYVECDPMKVAHHSAYLPWLELARTELLRRSGFSYAECEATGIYFAVASINIRYRRPAFYDDVINIDVTLDKVGRAKIEHVYRIRRGDELLAEAGSTLVCVDTNGKLQGTPKFLLDRAPL